MHTTEFHSRAHLALTLVLRRPVAQGRAYPNSWHGVVHMQNANNALTTRRSSRVPANLPLFVTSLESATHFSEVCETLVVNAHGCSMRSPRKLNVGVVVLMHSKDGREATAKVVYCQPLESDRQGWRVGATLDRPENFWGLKPCPQDWGQLARPPAPGKEKFPFKALSTPGPVAVAQPAPIPASLKATLEKIQSQVSPENLRAIAAELVNPLQAEVAELREKLGEVKRRRFEVSLSQIPPELEEQLEQRLKTFVGQRIQAQVREQSAQMLEAAKATIDQKTTASHNQFLQRVKQEVEAVEHRTKDLSTDISGQLRDHLNRQQGEFHQQVADAGTRMRKLSDELLQTLKGSLGEEHAGRRRELEQVQGLVVSDASRVREQVAELTTRVDRLGESARDLESGLDKRLSQMASNTVSAARPQLESIAEELAAEFESRISKDLGNQLEHTRRQLNAIEEEIEASASESLTGQAREILKSFECGMEELAQQGLVQWRETLASGLNSLVRTLGEQFRMEGGSGNGTLHFPVDGKLDS